MGRRTAIRRIGREFLSERAHGQWQLASVDLGGAQLLYSIPALGDRLGGLLNHTIELLFGRALWEQV